MSGGAGERQSGLVAARASSLRRVLELALGLVLVTACVARPPVMVVTEHGVARAGSQVDAERVAAALAVAPRIRATLEATREDLPDVWVVDRDLDGARGVCYEHRIELASAGEFLDVFVAHELVHWYADGSSYDAMPHFVEEGLADYLSLELFGLLEGRRQEHRRLGTLSTTTRALEADVGRYFELPDEESTAASRVGFEVVSRMGLERVRELARQGAGAWDYLHAAGMEPDGEAGPGSGAILSRPTVNSALE